MQIIQRSYFTCEGERVHVCFLAGRWVLLARAVKNLGRLWLAYTEPQGEFFMLQLISVDSRHFTPCGLALVPSDVGKNHGQLTIKTALHSWNLQVQGQTCESESTLKDS